MSSSSTRSCTGGTRSVRPGSILRWCSASPSGPSPSASEPCGIASSAWDRSNASIAPSAVDGPGSTSAEDLLEGVALVEVAAVEAAAEPGHALLGRAVGECLRIDSPLRLLLDAIVPNRRRRIQRLLDLVRVVELIAGCGVVGPHAG